MLKINHILLYLLCATSAAAYSVTVNLNPYAGSGIISDGSKVKSVTGIRGGLEQTWAIAGSRWVLGPRIEVGNTYVNTSSHSNDRRTISTYDNRFLVGGIHAGMLFNFSGKFPHEIYTTLCTGRGVGKLNQDESREDYYAQAHYSGIKGRYHTAEVGLNLQVRRDLAFNFAVLGNYFDAHINSSDSTFSGEYANRDGVFALTRTEEEIQQIPQHIVHKVVTLSFGLNVAL